MSSGSDMSDYNQFRQGIYARGPFERRGTLPILGPEIDGFYISGSSFGQPKTFSNETKFDDLTKPDAVSFISDVARGNRYPDFNTNVDLSTPSQMDGTLEPLTIRKLIARTSVYTPVEAHTVKGHIQEGNESLRGTDAIHQYYEVTYPARSITFPSYVDGQRELLPVSGSNYITAADTTTVKNSTSITPFDESVNDRTDMLGVTLTGNEIKDALLQMDPNSDSFIPQDCKSSGAGFTYVNSTAGTDSIAFGGLKR